jgi:uncharacterized protein (TIRG00374 family)
LPFILALQINFIATFFNQALPSTVGGDSARIMLVAHKGAGWAGATYSVLIDRIAGLFALALLMIVCLPWTFSLVHDSIARAVLLVMGFGVIISTLAFVLIGMRFRQLLDRWMLTRHLSAVSRIITTLCSSHETVAIVIACSVVIHLMTVTVAWCCVKAVGAPVSLAQVLSLMPPVLLVAMMPISIAGWGVRESSMVVVFAYAGLAPSDGLTLSILFGAVRFAIGAAGGIAWVLSGMRLRPFDVGPKRCNEALGNFNKPRNLRTALIRPVGRRSQSSRDVLVSTVAGADPWPISASSNRLPCSKD